MVGVVVDLMVDIVYFLRQIFRVRWLAEWVVAPAVLSYCCGPSLAALWVAAASASGLMLWAFGILFGWSAAIWSGRCRAEGMGLLTDDGGLGACAASGRNDATGPLRRSVWPVSVMRQAVCKHVLRECCRSSGGGLTAVMLVLLCGIPGVAAVRNSTDTTAVTATAVVLCASVVMAAGSSAAGTLGDAGGAVLDVVTESGPESETQVRQKRKGRRRLRAGGAPRSMELESGKWVNLPCARAKQVRMRPGMIGAVILMSLGGVEAMQSASTAANTTGCRLAFTVLAVAAALKRERRATGKLEQQLEAAQTQISHLKSENDSLRAQHPGTAPQSKKKRRRRPRTRENGAPRAVQADNGSWQNIPRPASLASSQASPQVSDNESISSGGSVQRQIYRFHLAGGCTRKWCTYGPPGHAPTVDGPDKMDPLVAVELQELREQLVAVQQPLASGTATVVPSL